MTAQKRSQNKPQNKPLAMLAAGGTGGHLFPAQATARALLKRGWAVVLVTDSRGAGFGNDLPEVETRRIAAGSPNRGGTLGKLRAALDLGRGYLQSRRLIAELQPQAVLGFGGYPSVPPLMAASRKQLRTLLHEQNQVVGRANRLLAARADVIATSFPEVVGLPADTQDRVALTGNPVRPAIAAVGAKPYPAISETGPLVLLVTGGSQGARAFDELVPEAVAQLPQALRARLTVVQQLRGRARDEVAAVYEQAGVAGELQPFFSDMPQRLAAAHLLICRSGASTVAELAAAGRPALLIPYPFAADDHQRGNAEAFSAAGGGWVISQREITTELLSRRLAELLSAPAKLAAAAASARSFARDDAAERLADLVCNARNGGEGNGGHQFTYREAAA